MKTFKIGGIHPKDNKLAKDCIIETFPLPEQGIIFTSQHIGIPALPIVSKGSMVKVGQLLAKASGDYSSNIHSPFSGTITKIEPAIDAFGYKKEALFINVEGDEWDSSIDQSLEIKRDIIHTQEEINEIIKEKGIVGLGGACFPTHMKYINASEKKFDFLIINAVECEPFLTSDYRLLMEKSEEIIIGIQLLKKALGVEKVYIGIENNKPDAIEKMITLTNRTLGIEVIPLKVKYPQGAEKQLVKVLTGRSVPSGKLPMEVGCVVNNVGTAFAVYEAVQKNKPLIDCILTFTGKDLSVQKNYCVRVGTPFHLILNSISSLPEGIDKIISGGPLMGKAIYHLEAPVTKGTSSVLVMTHGESIRKKESVCIRCGKCIDVCPMGLEPYLLSILINKNKIEEAAGEYMMDCIECGCCLYTCPSKKPLLDSIRLGKTQYRNLLKTKNF